MIADFGLFSLFFFFVVISHGMVMTAYTFFHGRDVVRKELVHRLKKVNDSQSVDAVVLSDEIKTLDILYLIFLHLMAFLELVSYVIIIVFTDQSLVAVCIMINIFSVWLYNYATKKYNEEDDSVEDIELPRVFVFARSLISLFCYTVIMNYLFDQYMML